MADMIEAHHIVATDSVETVELLPTAPAGSCFPLSSSGEPPMIVTLAPKSSVVDKCISDAEVGDRQHRFLV